MERERKREKVGWKKERVSETIDGIYSPLIVWDCYIMGIQYLNAKHVVSLLSSLFILIIRILSFFFNQGNK